MNLSDIFNMSKGQIENPDDMIVEAQTAAADAKLHANNGLTQGLDILGGFLMNKGVDMLQGVSLKGLGDSSFDTGDAAVNYDWKANFNPSQQYAALGGTKKGHVEVEGGEAFELPNGKVGKFQGKSHEQGGIDALLPAMTDIFSKRIEYKGKTLAQRKLEREEYLNKLKKKAEKRKNDKDLLATIDRITKNNKILDEKDLALQEEMKKKLYRAAINPMERGQLQEEQGEVKFALGGTVGDLVGLFGQYYAATAPMKNTLKNRATDTPNENFYKDYGKEGLAELEMSKDHLRTMQDNALADLELSKRAAQMRTRNSARSANTARAFDIAANQSADSNARKIFSDIAGKEMAIDTQRAAMLNEADLRQRMGAEKADLANRQDKDNFYSQYGKDKTNYGFGLQNIAKSLNQIKYRNTTTKSLNELSDIFEYNSLTGEYKQKDNVNWDALSLEKLDNIVQKEPSILSSAGLSPKEWDELSPEEKAALISQFLNIKKRK